MLRFFIDFNKTKQFPLTPNKVHHRLTFLPITAPKNTQTVNLLIVVPTPAVILINVAVPAPYRNISVRVGVCRTPTALIYARLRPDNGR